VGIGCESAVEQYQETCVQIYAGLNGKHRQMSKKPMDYTGHDQQI